MSEIKITFYQAKDIVNRQLQGESNNWELFAYKRPLNRYLLTNRQKSRNCWELIANGVLHSSIYLLLGRRMHEYLTELMGFKSLFFSQIARKVAIIFLSCFSFSSFFECNIIIIIFHTQHAKRISES